MRNKYFSIENNNQENSEENWSFLQHLQIFDNVKEQFERKQERVQGKLDELFAGFISIVNTKKKGRKDPNNHLVNKVEQVTIMSKVGLASSDVCFAELCLSYQHLGTLSEKFQENCQLSCSID